jgi:hypothetical protein
MRAPFLCVYCAVENNRVFFTTFTSWVLCGGRSHANMEKVDNFYITHIRYIFRPGINRARPREAIQLYFAVEPGVRAARWAHWQGPAFGLADAKGG